MVTWKISLLTQILLLTCCSTSSTNEIWTCSVPEKGASLPSLSLPQSYSVHVESKLLNKSTTNLLYEVYFRNTTSLTVTNLTHITHCLYDYNYGQLLTIVKDIEGKGIGSCLVNPLQELSPCVPGHSETIPLFQVANLTTWIATDMADVRHINSTHFELCANSSDNKVQMKFEAAYIIDSWKVPEMTSSFDIMMVKIEKADGIIVNDYLNFDANPTYEDIQLPPGMFCGNMKTRNVPLPKIPNVFAMHYEKIFLKEITTEQMIFDMEKKYVLHVIENQNVSNGANLIIYDYNTGHKYTVVKATGQCQSVEKIQYGDLFVKSSSSKLEMSDALSFFYLKKTAIEYAGVRQVRGVTCNAWTGFHFDEDSTENITIQWYFTQKNWTDNVGKTAERFVIFRMDVWMPGNPEAIVYNIYQFDTAIPSWSSFDITPCVNYSDKIHFTIQFKVTVNSNNTDILRHLTNHSSTQEIQAALSKMSKISPVRLSHTEMDVDLNTKKVFFTASLLEAPREENKKFASHIISKELAYDMIQGFMRNHWNYSIQMNLKEKMINVNFTAEKIWKSSADRIFPLTTHKFELPTTTFNTKVTTKSIKSSIFPSTLFNNTNGRMSSTTLTTGSFHSTKPKTSNTPKLTSVTTASVHSTEQKTSNTPKITSATTASVHSTEQKTSKAPTKSSTTRSSVPSTKHRTSNKPTVSSITTTSVHSTSTRTPKTTKTTFKITLSSKRSTNKQIHTTPTTPKSSRKPNSTRTTKTAGFSTIPNFLLPGPMVCSCPTQPTSKPCSENLPQGSKNTISQDTLIGSIFGSFFLGIIASLVLFVVKSMFSKRHIAVNANFGIEDNPYNRLE